MPNVKRIRNGIKPDKARAKAPSRRRERHKFELPKPPRPPALPKETLVLYQPYPTTAQRKAIGYTSVSSFSQHRMQDRGRAIALGRNSRETLLTHTGNKWVFAWTKPKGKDKGTKLYTVTWDGIGAPVGGLSTTTYSQGKAYLKGGVARYLDGKPDQYTWAVWFIVNGIPEDAAWPPLPSKRTGWSLPPAWPQYPV